MKKLPLKFTRWGFEFTQMKRTPNVALYMQKNLETGIVHFEIVRPLIKRADTTLRGVVYPAGEYYPSSELWGVMGWTTKRDGAAAEIFRRVDEWCGSDREQVLAELLKGI